jgi:hypothetical protein
LRGPTLDYTLEPVDTTGVKLSLDVQSLIEHLAKNAHKVWACKRLSEGDGQPMDRTLGVDYGGAALG